MNRCTGHARGFWCIMYVHVGRHHNVLIHYKSLKLSVLCIVLAQGRTIWYLPTTAHHKSQGFSGPNAFCQIANLRRAMAPIHCHAQRHMHLQLGYAIFFLPGHMQVHLLVWKFPEPKFPHGCTCPAKYFPSKRLEFFKQRIIRNLFLLQAFTGVRLV